MTAKYERLQQLSQQQDFAALVPPLAGFGPDDAQAIVNAHPQADAARLQDLYRRYLSQHPDRMKYVEERCGPPPWIIRSAGLEDGDRFVNAGGYASVICLAKTDFAERVAEVVFSGFTAQAIAQQKLDHPNYQPQPIAWFAQRLVEGVPCVAEPSQSPYLTAEDCRKLIQRLQQLHQHFAQPALDTEWVLETDLGLVSATAMSLSASDGVRGELALGFGFASAQSPGARVNAVAYYWPASKAPLWHGAQLRQATIMKYWLVQVRPAPGYRLEYQVERLTVATRARLADALLPAMAPAAGHFLCATTLDEAWGRYLGLSPSGKKALAAVFVETGVACEHAGIMFRQQNLPIFLVRLAHVPTVPWVVIDSEEDYAYFSAQQPAIPLTSETAQRVNLPTAVQAIFDDTTPVPAAPLTRDALAILLQQALAGPPPLPEKTAAALRWRTLFPTDAWLQTAREVRSPSLAGWLLPYGGEETPSLLPDAWPTAGEARTYLHAYNARRLPRTLLPQLCAALPDLAPSLGALTDLRLMKQVLNAEAWMTTLPTLQLADRVQAAMTAPADARRLECLLRVLDDTVKLPIYTDAERTAIIQRIMNASHAAISPLSLLNVITYGPLAPPLLAELVSHPEAFEAYARFLAPLGRFKAAQAQAGMREAERLLQATSQLMTVLRQARLITLIGLCRIDLVDTYDQVLKAVLTDVVERRDPVVYRRYLDLLAGWIAFAQRFPLTDGQTAALAGLLGWITAARHQPLPDSFTLELDKEMAQQLGDDFLRWQVLMPIAAEMTPQQLPIRNAHQLHNLLHQWMLAHFRTESHRGLPARLQQLIERADAFGDTRSCLLRFTPHTLEISLPFVVHKASFVVTERELVVEFAELPNADENQIGRLYVFEALAMRLVEWNPVWRVIVNRVCQLGTWTLFLRLQRSDDGAGRDDDLPQLVLWLRTLFDAAYDFSYVDNDNVAHVYALLGQAPWRELMHAYVAYRAAVDFSRQRVTVYSLPFASMLASLCLDGSLAQAVADACLAGFDGAWDAFLAAVARLEATDCGQARWNHLHIAAGQLGLLLAAR